MFQNVICEMSISSLPRCVNNEWILRWPHTKISIKVYYIQYTLNETSCHIKVHVHVVYHQYKQQGKSEGFDSCDRSSNLTQIGLKSSIFQPAWPWNLMDDLKKLQATSSTLHQALCIISNPSVNSNWSYSPETFNLGQNQRFFSRVTLKFDGWPWKTIGHLFYVALSFVHHFKAIG